MNLWINIAERDPEFLAFLQSEGWTESEYNKTEALERGELRVEFNGGLEKTGVWRELPGAITETVKEQGKAVVGAAQAVTKGMSRMLGLLAVVAIAVVLIVYNKPVSKVLKVAT